MRDAINLGQRPGSGSVQKAEYLAKQGLAIGSIRRMVTYEFGSCPPDDRLARMVAEETRRRERFKRGPKVCQQW